MAGKQTLWLPGTDHAGIATQVRGYLTHTFSGTNLVLLEPLILVIWVIRWAARL
jgi:hypothetical protein